MDWLTYFFKRNSILSIRKQELTSLGTVFNKINVSFFYDKLVVIMEKYKFPPFRIPRTRLVFRERGSNVTVIGAVSQTGNTIPVIYLFPWIKFKDYFVAIGPPECTGRSNGSCWITDDEFLDYVQHFINYVKLSLESESLLLLDNDSWHLANKTV